MNSLPSIVYTDNLKAYWVYRDESNKEIAIVARYDSPLAGGKKKFHQFQISGDTWIEGAPSSSPLFGLHTLAKISVDKTVYVFEGEKCTQAAHHLNLAALTSMMGASQA